jgi:quercetin dioxygenase-like cupin family protein
VVGDAKIKHVRRVRSKALPDVGFGMPETTDPGARLRRAEDISYEPVPAADGLAKGVLLGPDQDVPTFSLRRFTLAPGGTVPRHTNDVEHEQFVLSGSYVVGLGETEHRVEPGDSLFIPAGTVHWYRNEGDTEVAFLCAVPLGEDSIDLVED